MAALGRGHAAAEESPLTHCHPSLLGRWGSPQDVADAVLYLVRADYITGEVLFVDGGQRWAHR